MSTTNPTPPSLPTTSTTAPSQILRIGTRASTLALAQTAIFTTLLHTFNPHLSTSTHSTATQAGDVDKSTNLHTLAQGGKSLWTHDLEESLLHGEVDIIVHSLKDVPTKLPQGCAVRSVGAREFPGDVLVLRRGKDGGDGGGAKGRGLGGLRDRGVVGTSSVRRAAMVRRRYPHLVVKDVRGNVPTRLRKLDDLENGFDAVVLAGAGVERLGLGERIDQWLGREQGMLGSVGQGALGVEFRDGGGERDQWIKSLAEGCVHRRVEWETRAERSLLRTVEGGCSVPVGVETSWIEETDLWPDKRSEEDRRDREDAAKEAAGQNQDQPDAKGEAPAVLLMRAMVVSLDGKECVEAERRRIIRSDEEAEEAGWEMAQELVGKGAGQILEKITLNRGMIQGMDNA